MNYEEGGSGLGWFLVGLGVGAVVAMLYTPRRGSEIRGLISEKAGEARDQVSERGRQARDYVTQRGRELYERGREVVGEARERIGPRVAQG